MNAPIGQNSGVNNSTQAAGLSLGADFSQPPATILIVDDSPDNLRVLSATLSDSNYDIRCAKNGKMALKAIASELPDLILLDIQMPELDGYQVCQQLKADARTRPIPVIFISALDDTIDKVKAFSVGGVDYITKPFQVEEVLARVRNQLNLQAAKIQLAQSEKMASLGQLVAGIAHEINNPVGFIQGNVEHLDRYVQDLLRLVQAYRAEYIEPSTAIQEIASEIDLDYLQTDIQKVLSSMSIGTERITNIIKSLRNFSRLDESDYKPANIHEGIDGTLLILESRLKAVGKANKIEVVKDYGELPLLRCYPSALNQVFMNILSNAIDALNEIRYSLSNSESITDTHQPKIAIKTRQKDSVIIIQIEDNGCGMPEPVKARLFSPFFTTKPTGKGTGLGMAISRQIVTEQHRGQISCQSEVGTGTTFAIQIPM